jgi:chemotaxis protein methyltransferase CheR
VSTGSKPVGPALSAAELGRLEGRLGALCGFRFGAIQRRSLELAIARRMGALGCPTGDDYVARIVASHAEQGELGELLGEFTNTETHFFRHAGRFRLLAGPVAESLLARRRTGSEPIRLLSAGCSSGEEAYSSLITLLDRPAGPPAVALQAVGWDINRRALERARGARYGRWSLRYTSPAVLERYFRPSDASPAAFELGPELRRRATFHWANLLQTETWQGVPEQGFDVVFCCNVLIYMTDDAITRILANLNRVLAEDGHLFLGYAESLQSARGQFEPVQAGDYVVYRRKRAPLGLGVPSHASSRLPSAVPREGPSAQRGAAPTATRKPSGSFAPPPTGRPSKPPKRPTTPPKRPTTPPKRPSRPKLAEAAMQPRVTRPTVATGTTDRSLASAERAYAKARAELAADRQQAALAELDRLLEASPFHLGARLLKGYIRGSQGDLLEAAAECTKVLDVDPCFAEAYLLLAILLRQSGDLDSAVGEVKKALFLEPDLTLGQYLLGQLHAALGQPNRARRAYAHAARTLYRSPDRPLTVHVPFELGRDALIHQIEHALRADAPG